MDNQAKLTLEKVEAFITGLRNGDTQKQISEDTGISQFTLSNWKQRALSGEPLVKQFVLLQPLRAFLLQGQHKVYDRSTMREAVVEAVTADTVTMTEKVTEVVRLTPVQWKVLDADLSDAFDAGEVVLVQRVTTTKTESPNPTAVIEAYQILFPDPTGDEEADTETLNLT